MLDLVIERGFARHFNFETSHLKEGERITSKA